MANILFQPNYFLDYFYCTVNKLSLLPLTQKKTNKQLIVIKSSTKVYFSHSY